MLDSLGEWLRQIIVVVLLATFIDLMLPNRTMQRYVKLVVSLFLLMTIMTPVLRWFGSDANARMLAATLDGWTVSGALPSVPDPEGNRPGGGASVPTLGEVLAAGELLEKERNARSLGLLAAKVEEMVMEHLRSQHRAEAKVEAEVQIDRDGMPAIRIIRIRDVRTAEEAQATAAAREGSLAEPLSPVRIDPVRIDPVEVEPVRIGAAEGFREEATPDGSPGKSAEIDRKAIALSVARVWNLPVTKVLVE